MLTTNNTIENGILVDANPSEVLWTIHDDDDRAAAAASMTEHCKYILLFLKYICIDYRGREIRKNC